MTDKSKKVFVGMVDAIIITVVLLAVWSQTMTIAYDAGIELSDEGQCERVGCYYNQTTNPQCWLNQNQTLICADYRSVPLSNLVGRNGVIFIIIMLFLLSIIIRTYRGYWKII